MSSAKEPGSGSGCDSPSQPQAVDWADDGVDATLIRWMLEMTPSQRLDALQSHVDAVLGIRNGRAET